MSLQDSSIAYEQTDVYLVNTIGTPRATRTEIGAILSVKKELMHKKEIKHLNRISSLA
jgi:tmRNA-binding protein